MFLYKRLHNPSHFLIPYPPLVLWLTSFRFWDLLFRPGLTGHPWPNISYPTDRYELWVGLYYRQHEQKNDEDWNLRSETWGLSQNVTYLGRPLVIRVLGPCIECYREDPTCRIVPSHVIPCLLSTDGLLVLSVGVTTVFTTMCVHLRLKCVVRLFQPCIKTNDQLNPTQRGFPSGTRFVNSLHWITPFGESSLFTSLYPSSYPPSLLRFLPSLRPLLSGSESDHVSPRTWSFKKNVTWFPRSRNLERREGGRVFVCVVVEPMSRRLVPSRHFKQGPSGIVTSWVDP